jgi:hypothetical protein
MTRLFNLASVVPLALGCAGCQPASPAAPAGPVRDSSRFHRYATFAYVAVADAAAARVVADWNANDDAARFGLTRLSDYARTVREDRFETAHVSVLYINGRPLPVIGHPNDLTVVIFPATGRTEVIGGM